MKYFVRTMENREDRLPDYFEKRSEEHYSQTLFHWRVPGKEFLQYIEFHQRPSPMTGPRLQTPSLDSQPDMHRHLQRQEGMKYHVLESFRKRVEDSSSDPVAIPFYYFAC